MNSYNKTDSLQSFLGAKVIPIKATQSVQKDDVGLLQQYDTFISNSLINAGELSNNFDTKNKQIKDAVVQTYDNVATSISKGYGTASSIVNTTANFIKIGGIVVISLALWDIVGRDIYNATKRSK